MMYQLSDRYLLLLDVETANTLEDALVYDIGGVILDLYTYELLESFSFTIREVFNGERELMLQAYYANKIDDYIVAMRNGSRKMIDFMDARSYILNLMQKYHVHTVAAYNCSFDRSALNTTLRYLTKSKYRWYFPRDTNFICIWHMATQTICQKEEYKSFAELNHYISNKGKNYRATAETVYAFLTNNPAFEEEHQGFSDVQIESYILFSCLMYGRFPDGIGIKRNCWQKVKRYQIMTIERGE